MKSKETTGFNVGDAKKFEATLIQLEKQQKVPQTRRPLKFGPLAKNKYTLEIESLVKAFLNGEQVKYNWTPDENGNDKGKIIATFTDKKTNKTSSVDLTSALKYANFNHFEFSNADYEHYVDFLTKKGNFTRNHSRIKPETREGTIPTPEYFTTREKQFKVSSDASFAEKCAINIYTKQDELKDKTNYYAIMNAFLRGDTSYFQKNSTNLSPDCNELLAHLSMCISGLNKSPQQPLPEVAWREVPEMPAFVTLETIDARRTGKVTNHMGMVSTNRDKPKDMGTLGGGNYMMFKNVKGVDVSPYSKFGHSAGGSEREILMPPTQIAWTHHAQFLFDPKDKPLPIDAGLSEQEKRNLRLKNAQKLVHFFTAEPVTTLTNMPEEALKHSIDAMNNAATDIEEQAVIEMVNEHLDAQKQIAKPNLAEVKSESAVQPTAPAPQKIAHHSPSAPTIPEPSSAGDIFDLMPLKPIFEYAYENHLSKRYTEPEVFASDFDLHTKKGRIERPNHGLPHTVRKASYIPHLVRALQANMQAPNPYQSITDEDIRKLQAAMIFSVTGRESDTGFSLHTNAYDRYKQNSADNFKAYFSPDGKGIFSSQAEINRYAKLVELICMPSAQAKKKLEILPPQMQEKHLSLLNTLTLCHELDEQRCWNAAMFKRALMDPLTNLVGEKAAVDLKTMAFNELKATGNKIMVGRPQEYQHDLFYDCSTNVDYCIKIIHQVALKTPEVIPPPTPSRAAPVGYQKPIQQRTTTTIQATRTPEIEQPLVISEKKEEIEKPVRRPPPKRPDPIRINETPDFDVKPSRPFPVKEPPKPQQPNMQSAPVSGSRKAVKNAPPPAAIQNTPGLTWVQVKEQVEQLMPKDIVSRNAVNQLVNFMEQQNRVNLNPQESRRQLENLREKVNELIQNIRDPNAKAVLTNILSNIPEKRNVPPPRKR